MEDIMSRTLCRIIFLTVLVASTLSAADRSSVVFSVNGGVALPGNENFSTYWNSGYSFGLASDFLISRIVQFGFRTDFTGFPLNEDAVLNLLNISPGTGINLSGGEIYVLTVMGNLRFNLTPAEQPVQPYLFGGVGVSYEVARDLSANGQLAVGGTDQTILAANGGGGFSFSLSPSSSLFIEGTYAISFGGDIIKAVSLDSEENMYYVTVKIGLAFH
jgi:hypothetical protein